jgi:pimeloyl-ACP methyl ester carboxylesterase
MHPTAPLATRRYINGPTGQIHVYDTGGEGPPLVLLHQAPTSSLDFAPTFPAFARAGQRLLAVDMPGFGMSDAPQEPASIDTYRDAALAVLDALGVARADLLGHHTGNKVAVELAVAHPGRVGKVILYGPTLSGEEDRKAMWDRLVPHEQEGRIHKPEPGGEHLSAQSPTACY